MATFSSPSDSIISPGGNIVGVDLVRQDVPNTNLGGNTIVYEGYTPEACTLAEITVFMKTLNTQGTFTATFTNVTTGNTILGSASFDMQTLSADTWTTLTLTGTASDLTFAADDRFRISFASNNASFDGSGIYFTMRFTSNTSYTPRAMDLLFSTTLTSDTAIISTGTLPTGYKAYQIFLRLRSDRAFHVANPNIQFNNDSNKNNYQVIDVTTHPGNAVPIMGSRQDTTISAAPSTGGDAHFYGATMAYVMNPESTTGYKSYISYASAHAFAALNPPGVGQFQRVTRHLGGVWRNTAAITEIAFVNNSYASDGTEFVVGSSVHVYGLK